MNAVLVVVPWLLSLLTVGLGGYQFVQQQKQANKRPFLEQQLATCIEATDVASQLATERDPAKWMIARDAFWRLYWGRLALVEDRDVEECMVEIGQRVPSHVITAEELPVAKLQVPSLHLAYAARGLILRSWRVELPALKGMKFEEPAQWALDGNKRVVSRP